MGGKRIYQEYVRPCAAEFIGQLIFTFTHSSTSASGGFSSLPLLYATNDGLTLAALCIMLGPISGCHVNFAVTCAVYIGGGIKLVKVPLYLISQLLGSLSGAGLAFVADGRSQGAFSLGTNISIGQGILTEVVTTTFLCLVVLVVAVEGTSPLAPFAIGFTVMADILATFENTGGCMNPTLSFGPAVFSGMWTNYWIYWVGPVSGAIIAGFFFRLLLGDKKRVIFKNETRTSVSASIEQNGHDNYAKTAM